jgi:hypothetical protein
MGHQSEMTATGLLGAIASSREFRRAALISLLLLSASIGASAQDYRGTDEQRMACTGDVFKLCWNEIPNVSRIVSCLQREKPRLSAGCRAVFESANTRIASNRWQRRHQHVASTSDRAQAWHEHSQAATAPVEVARAGTSPASTSTSTFGAEQAKPLHVVASQAKHGKSVLRSHGKGRYGRLHKGSRHRLALDAVKPTRHHNHKG